MMPKRPRPGDVIEVRSPTVDVYLHYLGRHAEYGDVVTVCPTRNAGGAEVSLDFFSDGYVAFFPVGVAVARGLASVVGHMAPPEIPKRVRRAGVRSATGVVETWIIEDGGRELVKKRLSDSERKLPIAAIWNREMLLHRVSDGWRPEMEGSNE